jgi:hypothetical protein
MLNRECATGDSVASGAPKSSPQLKSRWEASASLMQVSVGVLNPALVLRAKSWSLSKDQSPHKLDPCRCMRRASV